MFMPSPCLTVSEADGEESLKSSDGKSVVFGVFNGWRTGFFGAILPNVFQEQAINYYLNNGPRTMTSECITTWWCAWQ